MPPNTDIESLYGLFVDPEFSQLPPAEQYKGRQYIFRELSGKDPEFRKLPVEERRKVLFPTEEPTKGSVREGLEQGVEKVLGLARQVGGAPEAATVEGMVEGYKHSRGQLDQPLREIFGRAGEGVSDIIAKGRVAGGAGFSVFIPRFVQEGMGPIVETIGKGYGEIARVLKAPEPVAKVIENLTPDAVMIAGFKAFHNLFGRNPNSAAEIQKAIKDPKFVRELAEANNVEYAKAAEERLKTAAEQVIPVSPKEAPAAEKLAPEAPAVPGEAIRAEEGVRVVPGAERFVVAQERAAVPPKQESPDISLTKEAGAKQPSKDVVLKKAEDILSVEEKIPFEAPEPGALPRELSGAKPRYNYGTEPVELTFTRDLERAAYILAQEKRSARDADYLRYVTKQTGLKEAEARVLGQRVKDYIKTEARGGSRDVTVPELFEAERGAPPAGAAVAGQEAVPPVSKMSLRDLVKKGFGSETGTVGKLTPEQQAAEVEARAARSELYRRIGEAAKKSGKTMADAADDLGVGRPVYQRLATERRVDSAVEALGSAANGMRELNERARITVPETEIIAETGTLSKGGPGWRSESRETFREETGPKPETYRFRISEADVDATRNRMIEAGRELMQATRVIEQAGDGLSVATAQVARATLEQATREANKWADRFRKERFAAGRTVRSYNRAPFPDDVIEAFERVGVMVDGLRRIKHRVPIDTNIVNSIGAVLKERSWSALTPEQQRQFRADLVDTFRLNLFAPTSFTLDFVSNLVETSAQATSGLAGDMVHLAKGYPTFPAFTGMWRAIKNRRIIPVVEEGIGRTFGGEPMRGVVPLRDLFKTGKPGAFTERSNAWSAGYDTLKGTPMYAKGAVDTGFKRFAANAIIWREAFMEADKRGLRGVDRQNFVDNYWRELPQATADLAIEEANKAGFNRPLTKWEESFSRSKLAQLFIEAFGRWTFQFPRWAAEMLGYNPKLLRKFWRMESNPEELTRYLTRTATGIGGVYLVDQMFYDQTDFNSMEVVDEEGNRKRLSGRDHLVLPLFLSAIARGDVEKATGALRYVSIPGARFVYGEGGVLGRLTRALSNGLRQGRFDTRSIDQGLEDSLNRMIPGQAVLAAIKTVLDPTIREGVGANIPGVSLLREPAVDLSTGEPLRPQQRVLGVEMPSVGGTPIPGAVRIMPEAQKLLSRYGLLTYRGPRVPIAGYRASEAPEEVTQEWEKEFGKARNRILSQVIPSVHAAETRVTAEQMKPNTPFYERVRKLIQQYDSMAARHATNVVNQRHLARGKLPRQPSIRERRGLEAYQ